MITTAHRLGMPSAVDDDVRPRRHPRALGRAPARCSAAIQDETGGFTEFVLLPFVHHNAPIYLAGVARPGPTCGRTARCTRWPGCCCTAGSTTSRCSLGQARRRRHAGRCCSGGVNDLGGTLMEETISRMAGSEHGSAKTVAELTEIAAGIGRPAGSAPPPTAGWSRDRSGEPDTSELSRSRSRSGRRKPVQTGTTDHYDRA